MPALSTPAITMLQESPKIEVISIKSASKSSGGVMILRIAKNMRTAVSTTIKQILNLSPVIPETLLFCGFLASNVERGNRDHETSKVTHQMKVIRDDGQRIGKVASHYLHNDEDEANKTDAPKLPCGASIGFLKLFWVNPLNLR